MKTTLSIISFLLTTVACSAQWQLIDDFQQWENGEIFTEVTEIGWNASALEQTDEYWMLPDPVNPDNIVMYVESGNQGVGYARTFVMKALPGGGIVPGETGTLFFRSLWDAYQNSWHMATSDKQLVFDEVTGLQTTPGAYSDLNVRIHLDQQTKSIEQRDTSGYVTPDPPIVPSLNEWYSFWMVVENTWDMATSPPTCTGKYTLYIQGEGIGDGVSPTLISVGTDPPKDSASFYRFPADEEGNPQTIMWAVFVTDSGSPGNPAYGEVFMLDDFYFSQGENLSNPLEDWTGYTIEPSGDVDTGDWLGWINVSQAPYIFSYSNGWFWMDESAITESGAWAYFFK